MVITSLFMYDIFIVQKNQLASTPVGGASIYLYTLRLSILFVQPSICPSVCLFLAPTSTQLTGTQSFNRPSVPVCLLSVPLPQLGGGDGRELYIYINILIILSIGNLYIYLSVPLAGRSRYIGCSIKNESCLPAQKNMILFSYILFHLQLCCQKIKF